MELKRCRMSITSRCWKLLIVPYGIETNYGALCIEMKTLLIVPYGIETLSARTSYCGITLLIVPYGIETRY